jgi:hypothetical protein
VKQTEATAYPKKRFFLEMFTRDISLEDCLLDLVDNSIDSLVRQSRKDPIRGLLRVNQPRMRRDALPHVDLSISPTEIKVRDNCGGIPLKDALTDVFNFGHSIDPTGRLGAYGIGLKRALFKISKHFRIDSQTEKEAFSVNLDVLSWAKQDNGKIEDWTIPVTIELPVKRPRTTDIIFTELRDEVTMRLVDSSFVGLLSRTIARTYCLFLDRIVAVKVNGKFIDPEDLELAESTELKAARRVLRDGADKPDVELLAGLAPHERWAAERAGWYVFCNGRMVLAADKTDVTGWGVGLPNFHPKFRGFIGLGFFESRNPLLLPWTTTKRGLNRESPVYQDALREIALVSRPIIKFLDSFYPVEEPESLIGRQIAKSISPTSVQAVIARPPRDFQVTHNRRTESKSVRIQYDAEKAAVDKIRKAIKDPRASASQIGLLTFEHYLKTECP